MDLADLLRMGKQYLSDAMPGGSLNQELQPLVDRTQYIGGLTDPQSPISQDLQGWHKRTQRGLADQLQGKETPEAEYAYQQLMNMAGVAPVGMIKTPVGRIPETGTETRGLAEMLKRAGARAGYAVSHEGSGVSPSQYVTFRKSWDEADDITRQVRLSNHADKYPELASGVRTSVDPSTEVSFEQAVNWLAREGFPTSLSKKYSNVPTWEQYYSAKRAMDNTPAIRLQKLQDAWRNQPKATRGPYPTLDAVK